jgi:hypothetical protein
MYTGRTKHIGGSMRHAGRGKNPLIKSNIIVTSIYEKAHIYRPIYTSGEQMKENEVGGHVARTAEMRNTHRNVVRKPKGNRSHKRKRHVCEDNINLGLYLKRRGM